MIYPEEVFKAWQPNFRYCVYKIAPKQRFDQNNFFPDEMKKNAV